MSAGLADASSEPPASHVAESKDPNRPSLLLSAQSLLEILRQPAMRDSSGHHVTSRLRDRPGPARCAISCSVRSHTSSCRKQSDLLQVVLRVVPLIARTELACNPANRLEQLRVRQQLVSFALLILGQRIGIARLDPTLKRLGRASLRLDETALSRRRSRTVETSGCSGGARLP